MTHNYIITGMTCSGCVAKVKGAILMLPEVISAEVNLPDQATITMEKHIPVSALQDAISKKGNYTITESGHHTMEHEMPIENRSWIQTYKPVLLIGLFITGISLLTSFKNGELNRMLWMENFMAGFFLAFSFFKFLDLRGFANSYSSYDIIAQRFCSYGLIYPFIELALGIAYLIKADPIITNIATLIVMGVSSIGVIKSLVNKRKIQCACLGAVFNLPMSTITVIEDLLMVVMSAGMLIYYI